MVSRPTPLVFVAHSGTVSAPVPGGVQLCTKEFLEGLAVANYDVRHFSVPMSRSLVKRLKKRLGVYGYAKAEVLASVPSLVRVIEEAGANVIVINMANLASLAAPLRRHFGARVRIALISHGNESGDQLKALAMAPPGRATSRGARHLGRDLINESRDRAWIDHVFCLSETEREIEHWLGASSVTFMPRLVHPDPVTWAPLANRIGHVGTLDHLPNIEGLRLFLDALGARETHGLEVRVVGGPEAGAAKFCARYPFVTYLGRLDAEALKREAATWSLFVHPIFWYARGASMKLAQALAWGIPIVTTPPGARGYTWSDGMIPMAETPSDMAALVIRLMSSSERLREAAADTHRVARSMPSVHAIARMLRDGIEGARCAAVDVPSFV